MEQNFYNNNEQPIIEQQPEQRRVKKGSFKTVVALVAAVAVVGAGAGFGGALLGSNMIKSSQPTVTASYNQPESGSPAAKSGSSDTDQSSASSGDVSSALSAIAESENNSGANTKIYPTDVVPTGPNGTYTAEELYEAVNDTIVLVKVYTQPSSSYSDSYYFDYYFGYGDRNRGSSSQDDEPVYSGYGSGIVFTEDGYILTNAHVVKDAVKVEVVVNDYSDPDKSYEYEATVVGSDDSTDIAVLKVDRDEKFVAAKLGNSDTLKVGQSVAAIGNPGITAEIMFDHTMTTGIISGLDISCLSDSGYSLSLIQTDAAINSGNSGGGLFDMYGNVIGVVNSKIVVSTYEGLGFALTINESKPIMEDLLNYGYVKSRPVLGITTVELNEYRAQLYGAKLSQGLLVTSLNEGSPVAKSGLQISDVITKINGQNVSTVQDVQTIIGKFKVGDKVTATVARENMTGGMDSIDIEIELTSSAK